MKTTDPSPITRRIASRTEWLAARQELLQKEKELTRRRDELGEQRRALPWVKIDKPYVFEGNSHDEHWGEVYRSQDVHAWMERLAKGPAPRPKPWQR